MSRAPELVAPQTKGTNACSHCGLPILGERREPSASGEPEFCCAGCRTVYFALNAAGLAGYYAKRDGAGAPVTKQGGCYSHLDDPDFLSLYAPLEDGIRSVDLYVEGLHCAACVWVIERLPTVLDGVLEAVLNFNDGLVRVRYREGLVTLSRIAEALDSFGYPPHPANQLDARREQNDASRNLLARIGIAGAAFGNVMLLSFALYSGEFSGMTREYEAFFRWASLLITVPSVAWTGSTFFRGAWTSLRTRTPHMDLPISVGILAALAWGTHETLAGSNKIYFDSVTMLVFLLLIGRYIQALQTRAARSATDLLFALAPSSCRVKEAGGTRLVPAVSVAKNALIEVLAGERIGVDGVIENGTSNLDESLLTGESKPRRVAEGAEVHAGTINLSDAIEIRATRTGRETRLAQLVRDVEHAAAQKAPIVMAADKLGGYFVYFAMGLALLTYLVWLGRDAHAALDHAIALLIVTCPCALGMATPLAAGVALGRAARAGILVKGMRFLEQFSKPGLIVFDKTGTLTLGQLRVVESQFFLSDVVALLRAAEQRSSHPIARALQRDLPLSPVLDVESFQELQGLGVRARVAGREVLVGNAQLACTTALDAAQQANVERWIELGLSPLYVNVDGQLAALLALGDPLRPEAPAALAELVTAGHRLAILSGDRQEIVDHVVGRLGLNFEVTRGNQSPEQKLAFVTQQSHTRPVYMVGDGVNDAAALTAASVGIAMSGGAEASLSAADVFSTRVGLGPVAELARGSRATLRTIRQNIAFSLAYNLVAAALCITGLISPLIAAILMPLSSLTVVTNSLRAHTFGSKS